jgi:hypothetical protein
MLQALENVGGRVGVYQCEAAGDGGPLSSDRVGVSGLPCTALLVALPPVGEGEGREKHSCLIS